MADCRCRCRTCGDHYACDGYDCPDDAPLCAWGLGMAPTAHGIAQGADPDPTGHVGEALCSPRAPAAAGIFDRVIVSVR